MERLTRFVLRRRRAVLGAWLAVFLLGRLLRVEPSPLGAHRRAHPVPASGN
jgi:hypothetical protein